MFLTSRCYVLRHLCQMRCRLGGTPWTTLFRLAGGGMEMLLSLVERFCRLHDGLGGSPLFGSPGGRDRLAPFMLHREEVRRVRRPQGVCHVGEKPWSLIACRLNDPTVETRKGLLHEGMPGILIACSSRLLHDNVVAHGVHPPETDRL
jgi:hypothetical protein